MNDQPIQFDMVAKTQFGLEELLATELKAIGAVEIGNIRNSLCSTPAYPAGSHNCSTIAANGTSAAPNASAVPIRNYRR